MPKREILISLTVLGVVALLLFTIQGCWTTWERGKADQRTDDTYVRADVTPPMSTRVSGTVRKIDINDFETVKPGQLLVELQTGHVMLWVAVPQFVLGLLAIYLLQVRQQALTLAISDSFMLVAWSAICCLVVIACMAGVHIQYRQVMTPPAKHA